jgi:outer membrane lipoprotein SlyB
MSSLSAQPGQVSHGASGPKAWVIGGVLAAVLASAGAMMAWRSSGASQPPAAEATTSQSVPGAVHGPAGKVASICHDCGVIESIQAVKHKGEGSGVGAVAGGVVGGLLGNQVGHGNGKAAMTVIGAVGGGVAGHEIEKQVKSKTVYQVRVKLDDGKVRTLEQAQVPQLGVGQRVRVEGHQMHALKDQG